MPPIVGLGETALHLGSSALAPLFALPDYAMTKMGMQDKRNPAGTYAGAREKYVYQPRTPTGQAGADIAGAALKPVGDAFSLIGSGYGDLAGLAGASPGAQKEIRDIAPDRRRCGSHCRSTASTEAGEGGNPHEGRAWQAGQGRIQARGGRRQLPCPRKASVR